jgi:hypothetical protein
VPIRESERARYPTDWPQISLAIRCDRAGWFCECLGECERHDGWCLARNARPHPVTGSKVVLTVAHLDHTPENVEPDNLRAMCQRCHLSYDRDHHAATRAATIAARAEESPA